MNRPKPAPPKPAFAPATNGATHPTSRRQIRILTVDPDLAALWLEMNTRNRPLNQRRVDEYSRAMLTGQWSLSNDALTFDTSGVLLNGQHRLAAVVESKTVQPFAVLEGIDPQVQNVMDVGASRTAGQQMHLVGWRNANVAAAVARAVMRWQLGTIGNNAYRPTLLELVEFAEDNPTRLDACTDIALRVCRSVPLTRALVGALAYQAFDFAEKNPESLSHDRVNEFFRLLETGAELTEGDPILVLRARAHRYAAGTGHKRVRQTELEALYDLVRTWNAWRAGQRHSKLQAPSAGVTAEHLKLK